MVKTPAYGLEGPRFDPRQQPSGAAVIAVAQTVTYKLMKFISLLTTPSFRRDVKPRPRVDPLCGTGSLK